MDHTTSPQGKGHQFFGEKLIVVNIGIRPFFEDMKKQKVEVSQVDWEMPAEGDQELVSLLDKLV